jgi:hypothetical protein
VVSDSRFLRTTRAELVLQNEWCALGDLQKPQVLQQVPSSFIEIGITRYENEGKPEPPHWHKQAFEFQYMTTGLTAYSEPDYRRGARIQEG